MGHGLLGQCIGKWKSGDIGTLGHGDTRTCKHVDIRGRGIRDMGVGEVGRHGSWLRLQVG